MAAREEIIHLELEVLQAMCTGTPEGTVWDKGMLLLDAYPFQEISHQVLFEVLQEINTDLPDIIRKQLPARLTKKGFPALDFERFLAPHGLSEAEAEARMRKLLAANPARRPDATLR
jgi:hypothetical protein